MTKINQEEYEVLKELVDKYKWISRDGNNVLWVYAQKPQKDTCSTWQISGICVSKVNIDLFQFIQWEDPEPYNISELIKEYEYYNETIKLTGGLSITQAKYDKYLEEHIKELENESEETEVKKNIEWLKGRLRMRKLFKPQTEEEIGYNKAIDEFSEYVDQLDEPEVLSQEENINIVLDDLKEHIKEQQTLSQNIGLAHTSAGNDTHYRQYDYMLECINEYEPSDDLQNLLVPKQELPVIPKFVAAAIEEDKECGCDVYDSIYFIIETNGGGLPSLSDWVAKNIDKYVRAWLDGYTVEEEQKYRVVDRHEVHLLAKEEGHNKVETVAELVEIYGHEYVELDYNLTEQEIKGYDKRYLAFAVKVEELEE